MLLDTLVKESLGFQSLRFFLRYYIKMVPKTSSATVLEIFRCVFIFNKCVDLLKTSEPQCYKRSRRRDSESDVLDFYSFVICKIQMLYYSYCHKVGGVFFHVDKMLDNIEGQNMK